MEKVFMRYIYVVGMHHHGPHELSVGTGYALIHEPNNPYDRKAVAVVDKENTARVLGYVRRVDALFLHKIFTHNINASAVLLKAKDHPEVWSRRVGPQQKCVAAFKATSDKAKNIPQLLQGAEFSIENKK